MSTRIRYQPAAASTAKVLHVCGVGLRVDHVPAGPMWNRVQRMASPDEEAPEPPRSLDACREKANLFRSAALRAALTLRTQDDGRGRFVENYPVPTLMALPPATQQDDAAREDWSRKYMSELLWQLHDGPAGMAFHQLGFRPPPRFEAAGVSTWWSVFEAFGKQGDLNSLLVWAEDGYAARADLGNWEDRQNSQNQQTPQRQQDESLKDILARAKRPGQLRDTFSAILLLRPAAADWLREWSLHVSDASEDSHFPNGVVARGPHGFGRLREEAYDNGMYVRTSLRNFQPTPNVPALWSRPQYAQYAQMPTLALLQKPEFARFGAGITADQQADALEQALRTLMDRALRDRPATQVFYSAGPDGSGQGLLARVLAKLAPQSGLLMPGAGFRLEQCLGGELGAASMNAGIALASIAVWETGEPALVVNLRDPRGALVFALLPTPPEYRNTLNPRPYVI